MKIATEPEIERQRLQILCDLAYTTGLPLDRYLYAPYAVLSHADITGRAPEYRRDKVLEDSGVFLRRSRGQRGDPSLAH